MRRFSYISHDAHSGCIAFNIAWGQSSLPCLGLINILLIRELRVMTGRSYYRLISFKLMTAHFDTWFWSESEYSRWVFLLVCLSPCVYCFAKSCNETHMTWLFLSCKCGRAAKMPIWRAQLSARQKSFLFDTRKCHRTAFIHGNITSTFLSGGVETMDVELPRGRWPRGRLPAYQLDFMSPHTHTHTQRNIYKLQLDMHYHKEHQSAKCSI